MDNVEALFQRGRNAATSGGEILSMEKARRVARLILAGLLMVQREQILHEKSIHARFKLRAELRGWQKLLKNVIESEPFMTVLAYRGEQAVDSAIDLIELLQSLNHKMSGDVFGCSPDPIWLRDEVTCIEEDKLNAISCLKCACVLLKAEPYGDQLKNVIAQIEEDDNPTRNPDLPPILGIFASFDRIGKNGAALVNREGALRGWVVREMARIVPKSIPRRYAVIAGLLELAGLRIHDNSLKAMEAATSDEGKAMNSKQVRSILERDLKK